MGWTAGRSLPSRVMQSPSPEVRSLIVPLLVAATAACASFPRAADDGGPPWIEVSTAHFRLATDMTERPAAETSRMLENWWAAMRAVVAHEHGLGDEPDGEPFLVVALRSQWEREGVHYELGGLFSTFDLAPPLISIGDISGQEGREALRHELAHAFLSRYLPRAPNWLNEGMAAYLQMAEVDGDGHTLAWGMRSSSMTRNYVDNGQRVGVGELLAPGPWAGNSLGALEFRAGLLVHMLINRRPAEFACYLSGLRTALDVDAPLKTCFPARDGWDREIDDYAYSTWFKSKTAPFEAPPVEPRTAPLADASVHAILALLDVAVAPIDRAPIPRGPARAEPTKPRERIEARAGAAAGWADRARRAEREQRRPQAVPRRATRDLGLGAAGFFFGEVGAAVAGVGQVAVPAGAGAEHELHAARVAGADRALDELGADGDRLATHRTDEGGSWRHVTVTYRNLRSGCYKIAAACAFQAMSQPS